MARKEPDTSGGHRAREGKKEDSPTFLQGVAIVGNMNVGKSTLFSRLCETEETSVNFPGTTVSMKAAPIRGTTLMAYDTPGILSIFSSNEDERVSRDILLPHGGKVGVNGVIVVADAKNLKRSIAVALQYGEYGLPMLLDVNMTDEAASRGIEIDYGRLADELGVDICPTVAREGIGVNKIITRLGGMKKLKSLVAYPPHIEEFLLLAGKMIGNDPIPARAAGLLLLTGDSGIERAIRDRFGAAILEQLRSLAEEYRKETPGAVTALLAHLYNERAGEIARVVQKQTPPPKYPFLATLGDWCGRLDTGIPIALAVLYCMYEFVGVFGATFLVDAINGLLFEGYIIPLVRKLVQPIPSALLRDMIVDPDFGVLPTGVFLALGLVLPVIFCFYVAFGILEDSGYLSRISLLLDKVFKTMGLNGKGVIPLVMGLSCVTMSILTTRILGTKKEKNIASFLVFLGLPCAPLMAVMLIILKKMPLAATLTLFGILLSQILFAGWLANKIIPGSRTPLLMEIPPMRLPKPMLVLKRSAMKTYFFMKEAIPVFIFASLLVFLFQRMGGLQILEQVSRPVVGGLMGLPEKSVQVFIKTMVRRESGAAELEHVSALYTNLQLLVNLVVMTMLAPCMNAIMVLFKERGIKVASVILLTVTLYALAVGAILNHGCHYLGITFT